MNIRMSSTTPIWRRSICAVRKSPPRIFLSVKVVECSCSSSRACSFIASCRFTAGSSCFASSSWAASVPWAASASFAAYALLSSSRTSLASIVFSSLLIFNHQFSIFNFQSSIFNLQPSTFNLLRHPQLSTAAARISLLLLFRGRYHLVVHFPVNRP